MASGDERAKVARLAQLFGPPPRGVALGIGDDAAVLDPRAGESLVWTVDVQVQGVHFREDWLALADVGFRSFVAAASDLAAMGAVPWCALSSLILPAGFDDAALEALSAGQALAARQVACPIVGGNLSRGGELSVTTTLLGTTAKPVTRSGARAGDGVWVLGELGRAAIGLAALQGGPALAADPILASAVAAFRRPQIRSGLALANAHAAIDLSDGLALDAARLAEASGVAIVFEEAALLAQAGADAIAGAARLELPLLNLVLRGGEDYALLATSFHPLPGFTRVGQVREGRGIFLKNDAEERPLDETGFDHFA